MLTSIVTRKLSVISSNNYLNYPPNTAVLSLSLTSSPQITENSKSILEKSYQHIVIE